MVLVGTHRGGAGRVGEAIAERLAALGAVAAWVPMDKIEPEDVTAFAAVVVCTSTFGAGGVPPNAVQMLAALRSGAVDARGLPVGIVGLGDRSFGATYNGGCRAFADAFAASGAVIVGPMLLFDAADPATRYDPGDWTEAWWRALAGPTARAR